MSLVLTISACGGAQPGIPLGLAARLAPPPTTTAAVASGTCLPDRPVTCLMTPPPGAQSWANNWAANGPVTTAQFVGHFYATQDAATQAVVTSELARQGLLGIAHESWIDPNSDQADVLTLDFATASGAQSRALSVEAGAANDTTRTSVTLPSLATRYPTLQVFAGKSLDSLGNIQAVAYLADKTIELEFFFYSAATLDTATYSSWLEQELPLVDTSG